MFPTISRAELLILFYRNEVNRECVDGEAVKWELIKTSAQTDTLKLIP